MNDRWDINWYIAIWLSIADMEFYIEMGNSIN